MEQYGIYLKGSSFLLLEARTRKGAERFLLDLEFQDKKDGVFEKNMYEIRRIV